MYDVISKKKFFQLSWFFQNLNLCLFIWCKDWKLSVAQQGVDEYFDVAQFAVDLEF